MNKKNIRNTKVVYLDEESLILLLNSLHARSCFIAIINRKDHSQYGKIKATQQNVKPNSILQGSA